MNHKRIGFLGCFSLAAILAASCGTATGLGENEAIDAIREGRGYPKQISVNYAVFRADSPFGREVGRLVREGYLIPGNYLAGHKVTEAGKSFLVSCIYNPTSGGKYDRFRAYTHQRDVTRIVEILVDDKSGTAKVTYEVVPSLTEYGEVLRVLDTEHFDKKAERGVEAHEEQVLLKKWDKGWRFESLVRRSTITSERPSNRIPAANDAETTESSALKALIVGM